MQGILECASGNQYSLMECLGMGSFGGVYKAEDMSSKRTVAVKMLHSELDVNDIENEVSLNCFHLSINKHTYSVWKLAMSTP